MAKKILLIGSGAREHVIGETLVKSGAEIFMYAKTRNPGLLQLAQDYEVGGLDDFEHLGSYAKKIRPDFAFIGPDDPIGAGMADFLQAMGIQAVAPLKTVARLESSKSFTRDLVAKYNIPGNPRFRVFFDDAGIEDFIKELGGNYVVKADILMGGKGVKVSGEHLADIAAGVAYAQECLRAAGKVVIEEKLIGQEFSLMSFCDGLHTAEMPAVQDHKRAYEGDIGPNTGGMGSYSDRDHLLPFLTQNDLEEARVITHQVAAALKQETEVLFKGIMYGGFMATADGVRLIEYNARFGDPEAMNVLPIMNTNFVHVCEAILSGDLKNLPVEFQNKATVCKYIVPEGYPDHPQKGQKITISKMPKAGHAVSAPATGTAGTAATATAGTSATTGAAGAEVKMYYSSVDMTPDGITMSSSRAVAFVGIANTLADAEKSAEKACSGVEGPVFYRKDIGTAALIWKRVDMMKKLRSGAR